MNKTKIKKKVYNTLNELKPWISLSEYNSFKFKYHEEYSDFEDWANEIEKVPVDRIAEDYIEMIEEQLRDPSNEKDIEELIQDLLENEQDFTPLEYAREEYQNIKGQEAIKKELKENRGEYPWES